MPALRRRARSVLLAAAVLLGATLGAAPAASADALLLHRDGLGATWTAATVTTPGAAVTSLLRLEQVALPLHLGARLYDDRRQLVASSNVTLRSPEEGVLVQSDPAPGLGVHLDELRQTDDGRLADVVGSFTVNPTSAVHTGRLTLVLWVATADAGRWDWQLTGGDGVRLLGATTGSRLFVATSRDFRAGLVNAAGGTHVGEQGLQVRAQAGSVHERQLGAWVGSYYRVLSSADTLSVLTPQGTRQCVPDCAFDAVTGPEAAGPGQYAFRLTGAGAGGAGGQNAGDVVVAGAEVVLPAAAD